MEVIVRSYHTHATKGDPRSQNCLAIMYNGGMGVKKDKAAALKYWEQAASSNHVLAQCSLGVLYEARRDHKSAVKWFQRAAYQGEPQAQCNLGIAYHTGKKGVRRDVAKGIMWFERAAAQGNPQAAYNLGALNANGGSGVIRDMEKAVQYMRLAANQGHMKAAQSLELMLEYIKKQQREALKAEEENTLSSITKSSHSGGA